VFEIQRIENVRVGRNQIHRIADHQRSAFMTVQYAGRKCPGHLQAADVVGIDLIEAAEARVGEIFRGHDPTGHRPGPAGLVVSAARATGAPCDPRHAQRENEDCPAHVLESP
jgi:hypothetical protein